MLELWQQLVILAVFAMAPFGEGRISIPLGILSGSVSILGLTLSGFGLPAIFVFTYVLLFNTIGILIAYFFFNHLIHYFLHFKLIHRLHQFYIERKLKKVKPYIDKYGFLGLSLFVAIPLPGSGVWTAALVANVLEISFRRYFFSAFFGLIIMTTIVTNVVLGSSFLF